MKIRRNRELRTKFTLTVAAALTLLCGCSGTSEKDPEQQKRMIDLSEAVPLMKDGRDFRVKATLSLNSLGKQHIYYGLTDDLMAHGSEFERDDPQTGLSPSSAVLTNPATGKIIRLSDGESRPKPTQFPGMAYANKTVVWTETTSDTLESADWVLYAYDLANQKEKILARSTDLVSAADPLRPSGGPVPRISGSKV